MIKHIKLLLILPLFSLATVSCNQAELDQLKVELDTAKAENEKLTAERDMAIARAETAEAQAVELAKGVTACVRHILIMTDGTEKDVEKKALADSLVNVIKEQNNFEEMVTKYSEDKASVPSGGVYCGFTRGQMVPEFESASFNNPIGSIVIAKTTYGYHIIEILDPAYY